MFDQVLNKPLLDYVAKILETYLNSFDMFLKKTLE